MGMPGFIHIEIKTTFNDADNSVSRSLRFRGGVGLNMLCPSRLGDPSMWSINKSIMEDTSELVDGVYKLSRQHVGPGVFDYKWMVDGDALED